MSKLGWYWHRLRAMSPGEMLLHAQKKFRQAADARRTAWPDVDLGCSGAFPKLPKPEEAPEALREALRRDVENILAGRWRFFGHLELQIDDPPKWQCDYLVRRDMATTESAFKLNYRTLPEGVDSKLIWEPSRWYQLVRLAMAAYVLNDNRAGEMCVAWLEDWVKHNPPYRGWNWTSALEVGLRLIQFAWIDALLGGDCGAPFTDRLAKLRREILPAHVWYVWRHKSFGSSANNHLLGELVGCILAMVRWPGLARCGASLEELQRRWEHEVLAQFAEDGGNKEQALNYQLFSWEFCWQARMAMASAGRTILPEVDERLRRAAQFFVDMQVPEEPWDYGDSDNAFVVPLFADETKVVAEWHEWFRQPSKESGLEYWMGTARRDASLSIPNSKTSGWQHFERSGYATRRDGDWMMRWDLSPLGLGPMAAHGHLDALHLSLWLGGVAMVIDPGTGAYHSDKPLRSWLASREAHNGALPDDYFGIDRLGPFLWSCSHDPPSLSHESSGAFGMWAVPSTAAVPWKTRRGVTILGGEVLIDDQLTGVEPRDTFSVRWQFAPESHIEDLGQRRFRVTRRGVSMQVQVSPDWAEVFCVTQQSQVAQADPESPLAGTVSPAFRKIVWAPYLKLVARPSQDKPCVFTTTFLASADS